MRFPQHHIADSIVARILVASKRIQAGELPKIPNDPPATGSKRGNLLPPPGLVKVAGGENQGASREAPTELPGLDQSGLDPGTLLAGGDSFDALLGGQK